MLKFCIVHRFWKSHRAGIFTCEFHSYHKYSCIQYITISETWLVINFKLASVWLEQSFFIGIRVTTLITCRLDQHIDLIKPVEIQGICVYSFYFLWILIQFESSQIYLQINFRQVLSMLLKLPLCCPICGYSSDATVAKLAFSNTAMSWILLFKPVNLGQDVDVPIGHK